MSNQSPYKNEFNMKGNWVYEILSSSVIKNVYAKVALIFFLPPILIFITPLIQRSSNFEHYTLWRNLSLISAASWIYLGPLFIYFYYNGLVRFHKELIGKSINQDKKINEIFHYIILKNRMLIKVITITWTLIVVLTLIINPGLLYPYGIYGYKDIWYYIFVLYVILVLHLTAIGIAGVFSSLLLLYKLAKSIDIMADLIDNNNSSIKLFGEYLYLVTKCFFSGVVFIPILIDFISAADIKYNIGVIAALCLYGTCFFASFYLPYRFLKASAENRKKEIIRKAEKEYNDKYKHQYHNISKQSDLHLINELQTINAYNHLQYAKSIETSPAEMQKVLIVFSGAVFPLILFVMDYYELLMKVFNLFFT